MPLSGMAKRVFSVATRKAAGWLMPTPPPMVMPSMNATTGVAQVNSWWLRRYSSKKNCRPVTPPSSSTEVRSRLMSPPEQKPRLSLGSPSAGSAWSISTTCTAGSSCHAVSAAVIVRHMSSVNAWMARGRLSENMPADPARRTITSALVVAMVWAVSFISAGSVR